MSHRTHVSLVAWGCASLGLLAAGCGISADELDSTPGMCLPGLDDENPCTRDGCEHGGVNFTHEALPDGTACAPGENAGACRGGLCALDCAGTPSSCTCSDPRKDCPAATECLAWRCNDDHGCEADPRTDVPLPGAEQTSHDCKTSLWSLCNNDGECMSGRCADSGSGNQCSPGAAGAPCAMAVDCLSNTCSLSTQTCQ